MCFSKRLHHKGKERTKWCLTFCVYPRGSYTKKRIEGKGVYLIGRGTCCVYLRGGYTKKREWKCVYLIDGLS